MKKYLLLFPLLLVFVSFGCQRSSSVDYSRRYEMNPGRGHHFNGDQGVAELSVYIPTKVDHSIRVEVPSSGIEFRIVKGVDLSVSLSELKEQEVAINLGGTDLHLTSTVYTSPRACIYVPDQESLDELQRCFVGGACGHTP